ncbi:MAG: hypothetical protein U0Y10_01470 [Spirosomataceae bacterium]
MHQSLRLWSVALLLATTLLGSCKKDDTSTPTTTNSFVGRYKGKINGIIEIDPTYVDIVATAKDNEVSVTLDFGNLGKIPGIAATTTGTTITVAKQKVGDSEYSGTGTLIDKTLSVTLSEKNSTGSFGYIYVGTKQ